MVRIVGQSSDGQNVCCVCRFAIVSDWVRRGVLSLSYRLCRFSVALSFPLAHVDVARLPGTCSRYLLVFPNCGGSLASCSPAPEPRWGIRASDSLRSGTPAPGSFLEFGDVCSVKGTCVRDVGCYTPLGLATTFLV